MAINRIFFLLFTILCSHGGFNYFLAAATATIKVGDELNSTSPLVSQGGIFTLGFFTIDVTNYTYLGIWYTNDVLARKVWVANRDTPIVDSSGVLTIDSTGKLIITSEGRAIVNISDQVQTGNVTATLEDSGNFVLTDESENRILWQSFDHPTNVLLPGMQLGYNRTAGKNWTLNSWLSEQVPASGAFSLSWESTQESEQLVVRRRGERYWTSGKLMQDNQTFEFMPGLNIPSNRYRYNLSYRDDTEEKYFTFYAIDGNLPMWILKPDGEVLDGSNSIYIHPTAFCYGYESDNGCVTSSSLPVCRSRNDKFEEKRADFVGGTSSYDADPGVSLSDCMQRCWNDCNCFGFASNSNGTGCLMWTGMKDYNSDEPDTPKKYVLVSRKPSEEAPAPLNTLKQGDMTKKGKKWIWIVTAVLVSFFMMLLCLLYYRCRKIKEAKEKELRELLTMNENTDIELENVGSKGHDLKFFSFTYIATATRNFSSENKLGEGGFGPVYKGEFPEGREIAVKRLSRKSKQGLIELKNELTLIAKLQHTNLIRLLGCCVHKEGKMLIYEYMPNKSLDFFLFDEAKRGQLTWDSRFSIIEGIAQGLLYLHNYSRLRIVHRDLKAANILLDQNMNPKISDFGMARIFKHNLSEAKTKRVAGTYGYMAPEYVMRGTFSVKSDVYSFGVLMLEILSGRKSNSFYHVEGSLNLVAFAWELWNRDAALELMDTTLNDSCIRHQFLRCVHVGLLCVEDRAVDRPTMLDVISMLTNENAALPVPKKPEFYSGSSSLQKNSVNGLSISAMEPR